jgi:membrane protease YdiL (CAAX protease family)
LARALDRPRWLLWGYLLFIVIAELLMVLVSAELGMIAHALLLIGLTIRGAMWQVSSERRLALVLTLAPLTRLIALALPLANIAEVARYPIVSAPLLMAAWIIIRQLRLSREDLGLRTGNPLLQIMLMGCGMGLGVIEYMILGPAPAGESMSWNTFALVAVVLAVSVGFSQELIFRGLLQSVAAPALGRWALVYVSLLFGALHIGYLPPLGIAFLFGVGLLFAHIVRWGGSILGVSLAHGLTSVTLLVIMPYLSEHPSEAVAAIAPWVIWGGIAVTIVAVDILMLRASLNQAALKPTEQTLTNIRMLRREAGLTYIALAKRTGIPARLIAEIEHGLQPFQSDQLSQLAAGLGVTPQALIPRRAK